MRHAPLLLLAAAALAAAGDSTPPPGDSTLPPGDTLLLPSGTTLPANGNNATNVFVIEDFGNQTVVFDAGNGTVLDVEGEPVIRHKRTFGDVVFRGLADVLGYSVARKPTVFPPPLAPVPGIDAPLQAAPAPAPAPAPAAAPPPCGAPRAAAPPPCRAQRPPAPPRPPPPPPCPKPRAAPRPKPRPPPPPPPPPPCAQPRANPTTAAPCAPPAPAPPPKDNVERISSNFQLNFNWNRSPAGQASAQAQAAAEQEEEQQEEEQTAPVPLLPRAARLPLAEPRKPRVYVDAFVLRNGVAQRVDAVDAKRLGTPRSDDYLAYDDEEEEQPPQYDEYEDAQESRDRTEAVREFGAAVDTFWQNKKPRKPKARKPPVDHYKDVHFGDRDFGRERTTHQNLQRAGGKPDRVPLPLPAAEEDDAESTTTTEDPRSPLRPRVLPPTEHSPGHIDTVTVRVPPIYREKRPKKLNRDRPDRDEDSEGDGGEDSEGEDSWLAAASEAPRRKRRRKGRRTRDTRAEPAGDYDYYGDKLPVSEEERQYRQLTVPPPTLDADVARHEDAYRQGRDRAESERIQDDPERQRGDDERSGEAGRADSAERAGDSERAGSAERSDVLSPRARVHETGYSNNYVRATNVHSEQPRPGRHSVRRKAHSTRA